MFTTSQIPSITGHRRSPWWGSSLVTAFFETARCIRRRWRLHRMQALDDHMLDDIGVTREELLWAIDLPVRVNAAHVLHDRARRRRAGSK